VQLTMIGGKMGDTACLAIRVCSARVYPHAVMLSGNHCA
jgi:hypothetical protein